MAELLFIAVRADLERAETLAEKLAETGFAIGCDIDQGRIEACAAVVIVWSRAASQCLGFFKQARLALEAGKAVVACLEWPPPLALVGAPTFNLSDWENDLGPGDLERLVAALGAREMGSAAGPANDNPPIDVEFVEVDDEREAAEEPRDAPAILPSPAWTAALPETPLAAPATRRKQAELARRAKQRRWLGFGMRAAGAALLLSAAIIGAARTPAARVQDATPTNFAQAIVTDQRLLRGLDEAEVAEAPAPRHGREPASAPRI